MNIQGYLKTIFKKDIYWEESVITLNVVVICDLQHRHTPDVGKQAYTRR